MDELAADAGDAYRALVATTRTSRWPSWLRRRSSRSRVSGLDRDPRRGVRPARRRERRRCSHRCGRSRGSSRGPRSGPTCPPGTGSARRSTPASADTGRPGWPACSDSTARGRSSACSSRTPRSPSRAPNLGPPPAISSWRARLGRGWRRRSRTSIGVPCEPCWRSPAGRPSSTGSPSSSDRSSFGPPTWIPSAICRWRHWRGCARRLPMRPCGSDLERLVGLTISGIAAGVQGTG